MGREVGKENENDLHKSSNSVFNHIQWRKHETGGKKASQGVVFLYILAWYGPVPMEMSISAGNGSNHSVIHT